MGCDGTEVLKENNKPKENNEINESNANPEDPLIPNFHSHVDASESSIHFNKKIEQDSKKME